MLFNFVLISYVAYSDESTEDPHMPCFSFSVVLCAAGAFPSNVTSNKNKWPEFQRVSQIRNLINKGAQKMGKHRESEQALKREEADRCATVSR